MCPYLKLDLLTTLFVLVLPKFLSLYIDELSEIVKSGLIEVTTEKSAIHITFIARNVCYNNNLYMIILPTSWRLALIISANNTINDKFIFKNCYPTAKTFLDHH